MLQQRSFTKEEKNQVHSRRPLRELLFSDLFLKYFYLLLQDNYCNVGIYRFQREVLNCFCKKYRTYFVFLAKFASSIHWSVDNIRQQHCSQETGSVMWCIGHTAPLRIFWVVQTPPRKNYLKMLNSVQHFFKFPLSSFLKMF